MSINAEMVFRSMLVLQRRVISFKNAESLGDTLGSREEFVAWLLVRNPYAAGNPLVRDELKKLAESSSSISMPLAVSERPFGSSSPAVEHVQLEAAVLSLLKASSAITALADEVNNARQEPSRRELSNHSLRHTLKLRVN